MTSLDGWIETETGDYKLLNVDYGDQCSKENGCTWYQSKQICENEGGYLVKISTREENKMIRKIVNNLNLDNNDRFVFYLGLNDLEKEGVYKWISDGSEISFDNFYRGRYDKSYAYF